jgi:hypothetical protein
MASTGDAQPAACRSGVVGDDDSVVGESPVQNLVVGCMLELDVANGYGVVASCGEQSGDVW